MKTIIINTPVEKIVEEYDAPPYPDIGLAYLATYANKNGLQCDVIDCKFERINLATLIKRLQMQRDEKELILGFKAMTHNICMVADIVKEIKAHLPQSICLLGGVHVSALPKQTMEEFPVFDIGIINEGEETLVELMRAFQFDTSLKDVKGLIYRENGSLVQTGKREYIQDFDQIGYPDWSLFPKAKEYPVNIGRGCPVPCTFCMRASGDTARFRSVGNLLEEFKILNDVYKPRMIHFFGDDFSANKELIHEFLDGLMAMGNTLKWRAGMRVSNIDRDILIKMKRAGCEHFEIGVESGNVQILKDIKKGINLKDVEKVVKLSKEVGLPCWTYFIIGHPNETWATAMDTINFLCKINPANAAIGIMVPYPGTKVWEMAKKGEGGYKLISTDWRDYNKQIGNALELKDLSRRQLELLQLKGYTSLFLRNHRYWDFLKFGFKYRKEAFAFAVNFVKKFMPTQYTATVDAQAKVDKEQPVNIS